MLKQKSSHLLYKVCHSTHKRFLTGKRNARMYDSFISQEKNKEQSQKYQENMLLKTYLCYL